MTGLDQEQVDWLYDAAPGRSRAARRHAPASRPPPEVNSGQPQNHWSELIWSFIFSAGSLKHR
jgi:hypothetical protein